MVMQRRNPFSEEAPAPSTLLTYEVREDLPDVWILFSGEIDMSTSGRVDAAVTEALRSSGPRQLYLDLARVTFIDSSGITALVRCRAQAAESGCRVVITNPQPMASRVLEITGVLDGLAVVSTAAPPVTANAEAVGSEVAGAVAPGGEAVAGEA